MRNDPKSISKQLRGLSESISMMDNQNDFMDTIVLLQDAANLIDTLTKSDLAVKTGKSAWLVEMSQIYTKHVMVFAEDKEAAEEIAGNLIADGTIDFDKEVISEQNNEASGPITDPGLIAEYPCYDEEGEIIRD